jgi:phosphatidylglycerophosphate synthase
MRGILSPPNLISYSRIFLIVPTFFTISSGRFLTAIFLIIIAGLTDFLDGALARRFSEPSTFGQKLDPIADKIFVIGCALTLLFNNLIPLWVILLYTVRDGGILVGGYYLRQKNIALPSPLFVSKVNTVLQFLYFGSILSQIFVPSLKFLTSIFLYSSLVTLLLSTFFYARIFKKLLHLKK